LRGILRLGEMVLGGIARLRCRQRARALLGCFVLVLLGAARAGAAQEPPVPGPPSAPVPAAAYAVLERHCARCHQAGRSQQPVPVKTFANILALDEVAGNPALVRPGVPDASPLYTVMLRRAMPPDVVPGEKVAAAGPSAEEVQAIRDWIGGLPHELAAGERGTEAVAHDTAPEPRGGLNLKLRADKEAYVSGEVITFYARASADCYLTLIGVDNAGMATVLFPNEFEQKNLLSAGQELRVPGERAPYRFRANEKGRETLVGVCTVGVKIADGIRQDYERQWFTTLGDWRTFLRRALAGRPAEARGGRRRKGRGAAEAKPAAPLPPEHHARTAIPYEVR
jgi:hypothetical protein